MYLTDADILEVQVDAGVAGLYLDHLREDFKLEKIKNEWKFTFQGIKMIKFVQKCKENMEISIQFLGYIYFT